jgi:hypothetical protein
VGGGPVGDGEFGFAEVTFDAGEEVEDDGLGQGVACGKDAGSGGEIVGAAIEEGGVGLEESGAERDVPTDGERVCFAGGEGVEEGGGDVGLADLKEGEGAKGEEAGGGGGAEGVGAGDDGVEAVGGPEAGGDGVGEVGVGGVGVGGAFDEALALGKEFEAVVEVGGAGDEVGVEDECPAGNVARGRPGTGGGPGGGSGD